MLRKASGGCLYKLKNIFLQKSNVPRKRKQKYEQYIFAAAILIFAVVYFLYSYFGSTHLDLAMDEYNKRIDTYNDDVTTYNNIVKQWNSNLGNPSGLVSVARIYANEYQIMDSHTSEALSFIDRNENTLRSSNVDVYSIKRQINDFRIQSRNLLNNMKSTIESMQEKSEAILNLLQLISGLLI